MDFSYIITFVGGFLADLARRVLLPQSQEWIGRIIPSVRRTRNIERNILQLEVLERLSKMGLDPSLAEGIEDDTRNFQSRLVAKNEREQDAFIDVEVDRIAAMADTQVEMNQIAADRYAAAGRLLFTREEAVLGSKYLSPTMRAAFEEAQEAWRSFQEKDALAEGLLSAEGGSMMPLVYSSAMERQTLDCIARLKEFGHLLHGR